MIMTFQRELQLVTDFALNEVRHLLPDAHLPINLSYQFRTLVYLPDGTEMDLALEPLLKDTRSFYWLVTPDHHRTIMFCGGVLKLRPDVNKVEVGFDKDNLRSASRQWQRTVRKLKSIPRPNFCLYPECL